MGRSPCGMGLATQPVHLVVVLDRGSLAEQSRRDSAILLVGRDRIATLLAGRRPLLLLLLLLRNLLVVDRRKQLVRQFLASRSPSRFERSHRRAEVIVRVRRVVRSNEVGAVSDTSDNAGEHIIRVAAPNCLGARRPALRRVSSHTVLRSGRCARRDGANRRGGRSRRRTTWTVLQTKLSESSWPSSRWLVDGMCRRSEARPEVAGGVLK